jgi:hypothetical protein
VLVCQYLRKRVISIMAAGNVQYVPEILVIQSRGNSASIVIRPINLRQKYRVTIPGWIGIFLSVSDCRLAGRECSLLSKSLFSRDKDELMVSLNSYFHPMLKMDAPVSTLSYNVMINTGTYLPILVSKSEKCFHLLYLPKINQGQDIQISISIIILHGYKRCLVC